MNVLEGIFVAVMVFLILMLALQISMITKIRKLEEQLERMEEE